jgi:S-adenosylmethionine synthetase
MYQFTSESVSEGHPDKVADYISDVIADYFLQGQNYNRAAIETLVTTDTVIVAGEYKTDRVVDNNEIDQLIRDAIRKIGYYSAGFNWETVEITNKLHGQSADIALGTDDFGAGDQGLMFGYAANETPALMPAPVFYSHAIVEKLAALRHLKMQYSDLLPDSKAQVTMNYGYDGKPVNIAKIVCSTQHTEDAKDSRIRDIVLEAIHSVVPEELLTETEFLINPTGRFVIGGPDGDTGLTGRKIVVDTYGGAAPHGGGAFSGKDGSKVDRTAAYMARYLAKNIVYHKKYQTCLVQLSYAIGVKQPTSVTVWTDGQINDELSTWVSLNVDLTPLGMIEKLDVNNPEHLLRTSQYGHFGKPGLPWEIVDLW